jgi:succinoglycan biosynthesis protein ExoM
MRIAKAGGWIAQGLLHIPLSLALGQHVLVKGLRYICRGGGQLAGLAGVRYEEYRRIHGS